MQTIRKYGNPRLINNMPDISANSFNLDSSNKPIKSNKRVNRINIYNPDLELLDNICKYLSCTKSQAFKTALIYFSNEVVKKNN